MWGSWAAAAAKPNIVFIIAVDRLTVAGFLKQQGYATACIGKWHLSFQSEAATGKGAKQQGKGAPGLPAGARIIVGPTYAWLR